jgi:cytidylate kinase
MTHPKVIAIDGPAASGKSTLGEKLAAYLGYLYFDTGVMYRAVTLAVLLSKISVEDEKHVTQVAELIKIDVFPPSINDGRKSDVFLDGEDVTWDIRRADVEEYVSPIAAYLGVRRAMTAQQRRIVEQTLDQSYPVDQLITKYHNRLKKLGGVVMVGRDIGTVVVPEAELKIFLVASVEERARRRYEEVLELDPHACYEEIHQSMLRRDKIDSTRSIAPLKPADDAIIIKTDGMSIEEVFSKVIKLLE